MNGEGTTPTGEPPLRGTVSEGVSAPAETRARDRRSIWRVGTESSWTTIVPVAFIIVSLLSLVILPIAVSNHTRRMRQEISRIAEPARRSANQIQIDLSAELDKVIAYQVTGQEQYRRDYFQLLEDQERHRRVLQSLVPALGDDLARDLMLLFLQTSRWHESVRGAELMNRQLPTEVLITRLYERHPAYEKSLGAASELELAIQAGIDDRLGRIREAERLNLSLTLILTLLALTSALLVAGLGRQMRLLAREAMRRRQEAEREASLAQRARSAAERSERRSAFLAAAGQELTASLDFDETVNKLAQLIVPNLADGCTIDVIDGDGALEQVAVAHRDRSRQEALRRARQHGSEGDTPEALVRIMQERAPRLLGGGTPLALPFTNGDEKRSLIVTPLVSRGQVLGVITAAAPSWREFAEEDLSLFAELASEASLAVDNARLYREAQQAVRAREEVLAIVSHDLRNPLNAVMLGASLIRMSDVLGEEDREQIATIEISAQRMNRLIADLLDVTRLEGGKRLPIEPERVTSSALLDELSNLFRAQAAAADVRLETSLESDDAELWADRHRVMQVLSNLVGNALKFTPKGGAVAVRAHRTDGFFEFEVRDTGPGIPAEHLANIFTPYWQAKRTERMGAGLGLAIAKGIVEAHGGDIGVESAFGSGTSFKFTLPLARSA